MSSFPVHLVRHGETEWSRTGRHTGRKDIPLTERGREEARLLAPALAGEKFAVVLTSPLLRARETCELAGLGARATVDADLAEWDYGAYEGRTAAEVAAERPGWVLFTDGCPGGETLDDVAARADRAIARIRAAPGEVVCFAHGHLSRILAARWLGLAPLAARHFLLDTGTVSVLTEHRGVPAVKRWNARVGPAADAPRPA